jgi:hypothetical protein
MILSADKGNTAVVPSFEGCHNRLKTVPNDSIYRRLTVDLIARVDRQTAFSFLKKSDNPEEIVKKLIPHTSLPSRLYRLPLRLMVSCMAHTCWQNISRAFLALWLDRQLTTSRTQYLFKLNTI